MTTEAGAPVLTESERRLYARHVLLSELGATGQAQLCASEVSIAHNAAPAAAEVAREYLQRAGVQVVELPTQPGSAVQSMLVDVATQDGVSDLAGDPALESCAAWLAGAWAAVEAIKRCAGIGTAGSIVEAPLATLAMPTANEEKL